MFEANNPEVGAPSLAKVGSVATMEISLKIATLKSQIMEMITILADKITVFSGRTAPGPSQSSTSLAVPENSVTCYNCGSEATTNVNAQVS